MVIADATGLVLGAVALGFVHGIEPGHGWPVAASYAIDQSNKWLYGFAASFILGFGHLVSSIAMVAVFFWAKSYFSLTQVNDPITVLGDVQIGGPVSLVAGVLLIALGIREYRHGHTHDHGGGGHDHGDHEHAHDHSHEHGHGHDDGEHSHSHGDHGQDQGDHGHDGGGKFAHSHVDSAEADHVHEHGHDGDGHDHDDGDHSHDHDDGDHSHDHDDGDHSHDHGDHEHAHDHDHGPGHDHDHSHDHGKPGLLGRIKSYIPFVGGHSHDHDHGSMVEATDRGLWGIAGFAFVLGFAHEEEFEIIAICAGSEYCLELMLIYAATVIFGIVGLTLLLIAGYQRSEDKVKEYADYLPLFSAVVLIGMGLGFIAGIF